MTPARALEQNLDRVVDTVLRSLVPGRVAETEGGLEGGSDEDASRQIMADLCGHVAFALRSLDPPPPLATLHGSMQALPVEHPVLDVRR